MDNYVVEGTDRTPTVRFDAVRGELELSGRSIPENSITFYKPIFDWIDHYVKNPQSNTRVFFNLEYFNTSSSKCILDMLRKLELLPESGFNAHVSWYFEDGDEDMEESGNDFMSLVHLDMELVKK